MARTKEIVLANAAGKAKHHFCPICPPSDAGTLELMTATMVMPGRRMIYNCKKGHTVNSGETLLR
jgi:hypothetical protein